MAPILSVFAFHDGEQLHKNPSILSYTGDVGQNYLDLGDGFGYQENDPNSAVPPRHQNASAEKKKSTSSSRLTSLSSSLNSARTAVASRAKKLHVRESTRQAISHLRKSIVKVPSSRPESKESSTQPQSNQFDNDYYTDARKHTGIEHAGYECMYAEVSLGNDLDFAHSSSTSKGRLSKFLPPRPWIKTSKLKRKFGEELY